MYIYIYIYMRLQETPLETSIYLLTK